MGMAEASTGRDAFHASSGGARFELAAEVQRSTPRSELDQALADLDAHKHEWVELPLRERIALLDELTRGLLAVSERWVRASVKAKGIPETSTRTGEEWGGVSVVLRLVRLLRKTLVAIERDGAPRLPGRVESGPDGQLVVPVFPQDAYDRIFHSGLSASIWLEPGVTRQALDAEIAAAYRGARPAGKVALVLGAGNFASLAPGDALYKLFCELQVVVLKTNPVNAYLGPLIEEAFEALVRRGFLRVVAGGAEEGAYLAADRRVAELHLTGSDKTYDAIVFGAGDEGQRRRAARSPVIGKRFTAELGNVSPLIVVPGPWSESDIDYQAEHIASTLAMNAGFNCLSTRVVIQHAAWPQRRALLDAVGDFFARTPTRTAYYPGAQRIHDAFVAAHPEARRFGDTQAGHLPWTLISGLDPDRPDEMCFRREAFCSLFAETALEAPSPAEFIDAAVGFANEKLWGTLTATLLVHPRSLADSAVKAAVERAVARLRYGTVGVNVWGAMGFLLTTPSWGAYPGHPPHDIQSGTGTVNNTLMLPRVQKSVLRGPFRTFPKHPIFSSHRTTPELFRRMAHFEADPALRRLPAILLAAMRG